MAEVLVIGASCVDVTCIGADPSVFESGHQYADSIQIGYGGDALNQAVVLANSGVSVRLITKLGKDEAGKAIYDFCRGNHVEVSDNCFDDKVHTSSTVVLVDKKGQRNLLGTASGSLRELKYKDIPPVLDDSFKIVSFASLFISHRLSLKYTERLFRNIKAEGKILVVDTTTPKHDEDLDTLREILPLIDYFIPNETEAEMITGERAELAADLLHMYGVKNVIIKCGEKGCYLRNDAYDGYISGYSGIECVDTTGAGDSFAAGLISGLLEGCGDVESCRRANWYGAQAIKEAGATTWVRK